MLRAINVTPQRYDGHCKADEAVSVCASIMSQMENSMASSASLLSSQPEPQLQLLQDGYEDRSTVKAANVNLGTAHISCSDNLAFMSKLKDASIKLVVTSPPYNIGKTYETQEPLDTYLASQAAVLDECIRLLADGGSICWQTGNFVENGGVVPLDALLFPLFLERGLVLRNRIVWHFEHGLHCRKRLSGRYETICWWTHKEDYTFNLDPIRVPSKYPNKRYFKGPRAGQLSGNPLGKNPGDVWIFPNVKHNHVEKTIHPCQFPIELPERLVLALTDVGDNVLDPYMGVGSTVLAAISHGRNGFGCDHENDYVDVALKRVDDLLHGRLKARPMGKPVYDPQLPNGGH